MSKLIKEHTPGPWVYRKGIILSMGPTEHTVVVEVVGPNRADKRKERLANGYLIAAAPNYRKVLQEIVAIYDQPTYGDSSERDNEMFDAVQKAKEVLN